MGNEDFSLELKNDGLLYFNNEKGQKQITVKQCFPWSKPDELLSLRDDKSKEVFLIERISDLSKSNQGQLTNYLFKVDLVLKIIKILSIEEDLQLRSYHVETVQGVRSFQTKLDEWPEVKPDGRVLISDLSGDLFQIESFDLLDECSKKEISYYMN